MSFRARLLIVLAAAPALAGAAAAQEPPDSVAAPAAADTLSPQEALRARQRERLLRLSRPPGQDTVAQALDTVPAVGTTTRQGTPAGNAPPTMVADTVVQGLLQALPGYEAIEYQGRSAYFDAALGELFLYGDTLSRPTVRYQGQTLSADSLIHFREPSETVEACCETTYVPMDGEPVQSERLIVNTRTQEASAFGAETEYNQGARWKVFGDLPRVRSDVVFGSHSRFTSCELEVPHYHFETDELKIVRGSILVARPVRLYFGDVPVAWLPFVAQSLASGRASGLLTPRFSVNDIVRTSGGYSRRISNVGFYWAMNDYMDATFALDWFSDNFTSLTGGLSYRWLRQFMSGSINARQYWRQTSNSYSIDASHQWEISERTRMNASISWAESEFVREYSFNPMEITQEIRSQGGFSHRFDWGHLSLSGNRSQSISDERVSLNLPNASLSLNSITLFPAPAGRGSWFNNLTWSGGASFNRQLQSFGLEPADTFRFALADQGNTTAGVNQSLSLGNLSLSQSVNYQEGSVSGVPRDSLPFFPALLSREDALLLGSLSTLRQSEAVDISQARVDWSASMGYQQTLIGSTTLTPNISFSGQLLRSDTVELAQDFISAPARLSFGASLRSDIYGFFPGVGAFEAVRHKISPSVSYDWAPEVTPTELQRQVLGAIAAQPRSLLRIGISQTFEAKRRQPEQTADSLTAVVDSVAPAQADSLAPPAGQEVPLGPPAGPGLVPGGTGLEPTRRPQSPVVNLLALRTSALDYDFVEADSAGDFLLGFRSTTLRNEISSDYLRGLTLSFEHNLFDDSTSTAEDGSVERKRAFDPHLSAVNLGFSLSGRSAIFRWLGLGGDPSQVDLARETSDPIDPMDVRTPTDETSIIPGNAREPAVRGARAAGGRGDWDASFSYSLVRPRPGGFFSQDQQQLQIGFNMSPTESWDMSWRTSYDLEASRFNDHMVTLTRDLHRWQAHFDFFKTATGNWAFRFEVSLIDNQDLKFDYQQRNLEAPGLPTRPR